MRLFFGVDFSPDIKIQIDGWRSREYATLKHYVKPANYHLTLAFLGECQPSQLETVMSRADEIQLRSFSLEFNELGYWSKPGILWLGIKQMPDSLEQLAGRCRAISKAERLHASKKPYVPHITLARKLDSPLPAPMLLPEIAVKVENFSLFESMTGKSGVQYSVVQSWPLIPFGQ